MVLTAEKKKLYDRYYQQIRYEKKKEEIKQRNLQRYRDKKAADPEFHARPRGRPRKQGENNLPADLPVIEEDTPLMIEYQDVSGIP